MLTLLMQIKPLRYAIIMKKISEALVV